VSELRAALTPQQPNSAILELLIKQNSEDRRREMAMWGCMMGVLSSVAGLSGGSGGSSGGAPPPWVAGMAGLFGGEAMDVFSPAPAPRPFQTHPAATPMSAQPEASRGGAGEGEGTAEAPREEDD
jgi:hypothetical protein